MAVVATRASEAATNTVTKLDLSRAANSIVASCVLSPSSARNTAPNTVASSLRSMGGLPRFVGIEIGEFTKDRQHEVDPRRLHHLADRAPEASLLFGICNRADEHCRLVQATVEAVPNRNQLFSGIAVHARVLGATSSCRHSQVTEKFRGVLPSVIAAVNVRDGNAGQLFVRDAFQASHVDSVHLPDRRLVPDPEGANTAVPAEVMVVLLGVEPILSQLRFSRQEAKALGLRRRRPETRSPADRAVAAESALGEVDVGLEPHRPTVTAATVCFQHDLPSQIPRGSCGSALGGRRGVQASAAANSVKLATMRSG